MRFCPAGAARAFRVVVVATLVALASILIAAPQAGALTFTYQWGTEGPQNRQFESPFGIGVSSEGRLYVGDTGNDRIQQFDTFGVFIRAWGSNGTGNGQFNSPGAVAVDFAGNVYVADTGNNRIQKFDSAGSFIAKWGTPGAGDGQMREPTGVETDPSGNVYVVDAGNTRIQKFGPSGGFITKWGPGTLGVLAGLGIDFSGNVYVADYGNDRIQKFDPNGAFITQWGMHGTLGGQFDKPYDVAVDSMGQVYVTDLGNHRIQVFTSDGVFVGQAGGPGSAIGQFLYPSGIAVGPSDQVLVADTNNHRVQASSLGASITVKEVSQPNDPQVFSFTAGGGISPSSFQLDDDGNNGNELPNSRTFGSLTPGTYSMSEAAQTGWDESAVCSNGSPIDNISVAANESVTCTFTNRKHGKIVVTKTAVPQSSQTFSFTASGGLAPASFTLDDNGNNGDGISNTQAFDDVSPQSGYSVSESTPPDWLLTSAVCSNGSPVSNIQVAPGETVSCAFTNKKRPTLNIVLDSQPDDPQAFQFAASGGLSPSSFTLDDDGDNGNGLSNTQTFTGVSPESAYSITAAAVPSWLQQDATCSNGSSPSDIHLAPGEVVTCTFVMSHKGRIVVTKDARPNSPQPFDFVAGGGLSPSSFQLADYNQSGNPPASRSFLVDPGSGYSVSEQAPPPPWELVSSTCSDGSPPPSIDVSAGETVNCTFVNTTPGYVRPRGASPILASLVAAQKKCTAPTRTHGSPLAFPSCQPVGQTSDYLTIGTPSANGAGALSTGSVKLIVRPGAPGPPNDADVTVRSSITDVRCKPATSPSVCNGTNYSGNTAGPDYSGQLQVVLPAQITDSSQGIRATGQKISIPVDLTCVNTSDLGIGGTCQVATTINTLLPGAVQEGERAIWELDGVQVFDGGADGSTATADNTLFMTQGLFTP